MSPSFFFVSRQKTSPQKTNPYRQRGSDFLWLFQTSSDEKNCGIRDNSENRSTPVERRRSIKYLVLLPFPSTGKDKSRSTKKGQFFCPLFHTGPVKFCVQFFKVPVSRTVATSVCFPWSNMWKKCVAFCLLNGLSHFRGMMGHFDGLIRRGRHFWTGESLEWSRLKMTSARLCEKKRRWRRKKFQENHI